MPGGRRLVLDESLARRLQTELDRRGRPAVSLARVGLQGLEDPEMLRGLVDSLPDRETWILVTSDDAMPQEHGELLRSLGITLATIDPRREADYNSDQWERDVVHRWAHAMATQPSRSIFRYSLRRRRPWRPRRGVHG